jgi:hypothetical protein
MTVAWTQLVSWGPISNPGSLQKHYFRFPFAGAPHIVASAYLDVVSIGAKDGVSGFAFATFKRFEFFDQNGLVQERELSDADPWAFVEVERCVSITIALNLEVAVACGGWSFHTLT